MFASVVLSLVICSLEIESFHLNQGLEYVTSFMQSCLYSASTHAGKILIEGLVHCNAESRNKG